MFRFILGFFIGMCVMAMIASARPSDTRRVVQSGVNTVSSVANAAVPVVSSAASTAIKEGTKAANEQLSHQ